MELLMVLMLMEPVSSYSFSDFLHVKSSLVLWLKPSLCYSFIKGLAEGDYLLGQGLLPSTLGGMMKRYEKIYNERYDKIYKQLFPLF